MLLGAAAAAAMAPLGYSAWRRSRAGARMFRGLPFDVLTVDLDRQSIELRWRDRRGQPLRSFDRVKAVVEEEGRQVVALTNAGIFRTDLTPGGLHVEHNVVLSALNLKAGEGNFHLMPNGVFQVTADGASIVSSTDYAPASNTRLATQSGPLLVTGGALHPAFKQGSTNLRLRSGVGVENPGRVHFAISRGDVNFETFGELFRTELRCPNALFLDGEISRLYAPVLGLRSLEGGPFVGMLAVTSKPLR